MKYLFSALTLLFCAAGTNNPREPLIADFKNSANYRWLNKTVTESRMLDDMEKLDTWHSFTISSGAIVDARVVTKIVDSNASVAELELSKERVHNGEHSLLMRTPTKLAGPGPSTGRGWGRSGVRRFFNEEDWTKFNRVSIWIYPELPGFYTTALDFRLYNNGKEKLPGLFAQEGETSLILKNHEWNHIVWEIGNVARDKITGFEMSYGLSGNAPGEADSIKFYYDQLTLEKVDGDKIEGWDVWPGRISYSHTGYQTGSVKNAIANDIDAKEFKVINAQTNETVLTKPIESVSVHLGNFQVMNFSEVYKPGSYFLQAGNVTTKPFRIDNDVWDQSLLKALNFFYAERCGADIPGVHGVCHRDWTCVHGDKRIVVNGGWHDAGDLTQGIENSGEIAYALFSLAERLHDRNEKPELYDRVLEEARWGLDWVLKTSFGDGYRYAGSINSRRTNGIMGDYDDITTTARNNPMTNFQAASVEAIGYRVFKNSDPLLANYALRSAEADWNFAVKGMADIKPSAQIWRGTFDSDNVEHELASQAILCSVDLFKATGNKKYEDKAVELSKIILNAQQKSFTDWDIPMSGFFYTNSAKNRILHYCHRGREQGATLALTMLCNTFPDHADWMKWYSAVTSYSEYLKTISKYTAPYDVMPSSVYCDSEYLHVPESRKESFRKQVLTGIPLGKGHYLRLFPVWMDYRGHFGTILPQAQALLNAAHLRGDIDAAELSEHQLEWVIGRNPFSQSTMFGEGYDFTPLYTPSSGDIVGSLPVGIQTRGESDVPYWPIQATWTYKEIWVHPVTRWVWLLKDIDGAALVEGKANALVVFKNLTTGQIAQINPDPKEGLFRLMLPQGKYVITSDKQEVQQTFLSTGSYTIDLRADHALNFEIAKTVSGKNNVTISVKIKGTGAHHFSIRTDNLTLTNADKEIHLQSGSTSTIEWRAQVTSKNTPWVAVIVPDNILAAKKEVRSGE